MPTSTPNNEDLTIENLTPHVIGVSTNVNDERIKLIFSKLIQHAHDFVRETGLKTAEWEAAWQYLTKVGQKCTPDRQEMILLSDILGISALVDAINNPDAPSATESSVLGPFHNEANEFVTGQSISSSNAVGEPMVICGSVSNIDGDVVSGAKVDVWHTNGNGFYDMQDPENEGPDCRGIFHTDSDGKFALIAVRSVDYPLPSDGPVGILLQLLNRPIMRPAHVHYIIEHPSYVRLTTALYSRASSHIASDPVFGVKTSLIEDFAWRDDGALAEAFGVTMVERNVDGRDSRGFWLLEHDFVLVPTVKEGILE